MHPPGGWGIADRCPPARAQRLRRSPAIPEPSPEAAGADSSALLERLRTLQLSEDRFRAAVDAISGVLWTNDPQGRMSGEQPGWGALTGQSFEDYQGYGWAAAVHPDDAAPTVAAWERSVATRSPFIFEHRVRRADGRWGHFAIRAIPVLEPDGSIREWVGVHTDITQQRAAEALLRASNEEMQRYTHMVSHDLRAPLVNILGFTSELKALRSELLKGGTLRPEVAEEFDEAIHFIRTSAERMDRLLGAVLRISREGRRQLQPSELNLTELVETLLVGQQHQLHAAGGEASVGPLPRLKADRAAVEQVLGNLIDNAIKYRSPDRPLTLRVEGRSEHGRVEISVADNGRGIAEHEQERAFQIFRRLGAHTTPGEGVGLAYVKALVQAMDGTLSLRSTPGEGSTFTVSLPAGG